VEGGFGASHSGRRISKTAGDETTHYIYDGDQVICEYDHYEETISHQLDGPLAQGKHVLSISLSDYAGNTSSATTSFIAP